MTSSSPASSGIFQRWWVMVWPTRSTTRRWNSTSRSRTWPSVSRSCNSKSWATGWGTRWTATTWTSRMRVSPPCFLFCHEILTVHSCNCHRYYSLKASHLYVKRRKQNIYYNKKKKSDLNECPCDLLRRWHQRFRKRDVRGQALLREYFPLHARQQPNQRCRRVSRPPVQPPPAPAPTGRPPSSAMIDRRCLQSDWSSGPFNNRGDAE